MDRAEKATVESNAADPRMLGVNAYTPSPRIGAAMFDAYAMISSHCQSVR